MELGENTTITTNKLTTPLKKTNNIMQFSSTCSLNEDSGEQEIGFPF